MLGIQFFFPFLFFLSGEKKNTLRQTEICPAFLLNSTSWVSCNKIGELWNSMYKAWFPQGEDDPSIAVLRVDITEAQYWEASSSKLLRGLKYVAAAATGGAVSLGESGTVDIKS